MGGEKSGSLMMKVVTAAFVMFALGFLMIVVAAVAPPIIGSDSGMGALIVRIVPTIALILFLLSGLVWMLAVLLCLHEILVVSKNGGGWKLLWGAIVFFIGFGLIIYLLFGRSSLKT